MPLPVEVIATALNVPDDDLGKFKHWSDAAVATIGSAATVEDHEASERAANEFQHYFAAELERRRQQPQDDLLTHLLEARIDDDDPDVTDRRPLELGEILRILHQLLVAGNETTTSLLTDLMVTFGRRPDAWRRLREEPETIPKAVEEGLRLSTPASAIWRIAAEDTELEGVAVPAGSRLVITWMSGNRDEDVFGPDVDDFRLDRERLERTPGLRLRHPLLRRSQPGPSRVAHRPRGADPPGRVVHLERDQRLPLQPELLRPRHPAPRPRAAADRRLIHRVRLAAC